MVIFVIEGKIEMFMPGGGYPNQVNLEKIKMKIDNTMLEDIWFTADDHFGHTNIIEFCDRPFDSIDAMDDTLIKNWNEVVKPGDTVYHLADFTLGDWEQAEKYFLQLNGHIKILSNPWHHDKRWLPDDYYGNLHDYMLLTYEAKNIDVEILPPMVVLEIEDRGASPYPLAITLCHYSLAVWDRKHYGAWHLHGHTHKPNNSENFILNVGVDCCNFYPISLGGVLQHMYEKGHV